MIDLSIPIIFGLTLSLGLVTGKLVYFLINPKVVNQAIDKIKELDEQARKIKEMKDKEKAEKKLRVLQAEYKTYRKIVSRALLLRALMVFISFMLTASLVLSKLLVVRSPVFMPLALYIIEYEVDGEVITIGLTPSTYIVFTSFLIVLPLIHKLSGIKTIER